MHGKAAASAAPMQPSPLAGWGNGTGRLRLWVMTGATMLASVLVAPELLGGAWRSDGLGAGPKDRVEQAGGPAGTDGVGSDIYTL